MSLYDRIYQKRDEGPEGSGQPPSGWAPPPGGGQPGELGGEGGAMFFQRRRDPIMDTLRQRIHQQLISELGPTLYDTRINEQELRQRVIDSLQEALSQEQAPLSPADKNQLVQDISDDILGYGPIEPLLRDGDITEIMCNGPDSVWIERSGRLERTNITFANEAHLRRIIDRIVAQVGRRVDEANPLVDARLPDGSRVNAVVTPLAIGGPFLTIRKFSADPLRIDDLVRFGTLSKQAADLLQACVQGQLNIIVSGGTGSGKTTTLNVLSSFIPDNERIITIEDSKELQLIQNHVLSLESRPANIEGRGEITIRDLVRNTLRMRPDRIVVGEVRGAETLDMLQAMNTGHEGSLTTIHANTPRDTIARLETLVMMAGFDLPLPAIRQQISSAIDLIVEMSRLQDGTRRITHITEVQGMEGDTIVLQDVFLFDFGMGVDKHGKFLGHLKATGVRPKFTEKLKDFGINLTPAVFQPEAFARSGRRA
jgi:pilus assembly protein CpaF